MSANTSHVPSRSDNTTTSYQDPLPAQNEKEKSKNTEIVVQEIQQDDAASSKEETREGRQARINKEVFEHRQQVDKGTIASRTEPNSHTDGDVLATYGFRPDQTSFDKPSKPAKVLDKVLTVVLPRWGGV